MNRFRYATCRRTLAVGGTAVLVTLAAVAGVAETAEGAIAAQPVRMLDGTVGTLTLDPVQGGVLVLGFSRESNPQAREWYRQLRVRSSGQGHVAVPLYNVVVLVGAPRLVRGLIRRGIRSGVAEEDRSTFYIVEEDDAFWRALAAVEDDAPAYVLRVDPKGLVCRRHVGPATEQAVARILAAACPDVGSAP